MEWTFLLERVLEPLLKRLLTGYMEIYDHPYFFLGGSLYYSC